MNTSKAKRIDIKWSKILDFFGEHLDVVLKLIGASLAIWLVVFFIKLIIREDEYDRTHKFVTVGQLVEPLYGDSLLEIPNYLDDEQILIFRLKYKDENQIPLEGQIKIKKKILTFVESKGDSMVMVSSRAYKDVIRDNEISSFDWIKENINSLNKVYIYYSGFNTMRLESIKVDSVLREEIPDTISTSSDTVTVKIKRKRRAL